VKAAAAAALMMAAFGVGRGAAADQAAAAGSIRPGQWEMTARMDSVEVPGLSDDQLEQMRAAVTRPNTSLTCITPEKAADPLGEFRRSAASVPEQTCEISEDVFSGGVMRIAMMCRGSGEAPGSTRMSLIGQYTATSIDGRLSIGTESPPPAPEAQPQVVRLSGSYTGRRLGECPHAPAAPAEPAPQN
jgi:hypothetical protein